MNSLQKFVSKINKRFNKHFEWFFTNGNKLYRLERLRKIHKNKKEKPK